MTLEEFKNLYTENPNDDSIMEEISRLYESERTLTASFAEADSARQKLQSDLDEANKRYRERFFSGGTSPLDENRNNGDPFAQFFKERN